MALDLSRYDGQRAVIVHRHGCPVYSTGIQWMQVSPVVAVEEGWVVNGCGWCKPRFAVVAVSVRRVRVWPRVVPRWFQRGVVNHRTASPWPPYGTVAVDVRPGVRVKQWRQYANCRSDDDRLQGWFTWLWASEHQRAWPVTVMKVLCSECPVRAECLEAGVWGGEEWGVWGGATVEERTRLYRKWTLEGRRGPEHGSRVAVAD